MERERKRLEVSRRRNMQQLEQMVNYEVTRHQIQQRQEQKMKVMRPLSWPGLRPGCSLCSGHKRDARCLHLSRCTHAHVLSAVPCPGL